MKRTYSINNNLPPYLSLKSTDKGYYEPWIEPYFGTGADGDFSTTGNVNLVSTVNGPYVIKHYKNLTINSGHIFSLSNRAKGLVLHVEENLTVNGTITMEAKGANLIPTNVEKFAIKAIKRRVPPHDQIEIIGYEYLELGTMSTSTSPFSWRPDNASGYGQAGADGEASIALGIGGQGGFGALIVFPTDGTLFTIAGLGTCYSGGAAAGGRAQNDPSTFNDLDSNATQQGVGGKGVTDESVWPCGGGAGAPGGLGSGAGYGGSQGYAADAGKGGSIIIICKNFYGNGLITSPGSKGGDVYISTSAYNLGGIGIPGGGSAGGPITIRYKNNFFTGSITSPGGLGGVTTGATTNWDGGKGGGGFISVEQIT